MNAISPLEKAFGLLKGPYGMSRLLGIKATPIYRWKQLGRLPGTEYLPDSHPKKTHYAEKIEAATHGAITKAELLSYVPPQP